MLNNNNNKLITLLLFCFIINIVSGQFSFGGTESGFAGFKLSGPLGQLMRGSSPLNLMSSNYGFGQLLGSLMNGGTSNGGGGPLSQLATAASSQYMNAIRSNPLLSQFANVAANQQTSASSPYVATHQPPHPPHPQHPMYHQNPMALLGGDSSMYVPPPPPPQSGPQPGYDHHFGGSNAFPQFATPDNYFPGGPYGGPPQIPSYGPSQYGSQLPSPIHHLDRKK